MILTEQELEKVRFYAAYNNTLDKYVYLRKDNLGYYLEYAFIPGAPHDNRCIDWYSSYQEEAYIRNGWVKSEGEARLERLNLIRMGIDEKVNQIFYLQSFTCGYEENETQTLKDRKTRWNSCHIDENGVPEPFNPEDHICKVGKPAKHCLECQAKHWTYTNPVKCACWHPTNFDIPTRISIPIEVAMKMLGWQ